MRQIGFKNFRKFENFPMLNLGEITVLVGRNNAGKSTMVKAILLLLDNLKCWHKGGSGSAITDFRFDATYSNNTHIGTFKRALNSYTSDSSMQFCATFTDTLPSSLTQNNKVDFTVIIDVYGDKTIDNSIAQIKHIKIINNITGISYGFDFNINRMYIDIPSALQNVTEGEDISALKKEAATEKDPIKVAQLTEKIQRYTKSSKSKEEQSHIETDINFNDQFRKLDILSSLIYTVTQYIATEPKGDKRSKEYKTEKANRLILEKYKSEIESFASQIALVLLTKNIEYIYAHSVTQRAIFSIDDKNDYLATTLHEYYNANISKKDKAKEFLVSWLKQLEIGEDFEVKTIQGEGYTAVLTRSDKTKLHLADLGMGSIQLVVLLLRLAIAIKRSERSNIKPTIIVEEPEQNLHPSKQGQLAELFYMASSEFGLRFIIETHSEYLIRRSQVIVAENSDKEEWANPFAVYYFPEDGVPYDMKYTKYGRFEEKFGEGFFDAASDLNMRIIRKERGL